MMIDFIPNFQRMLAQNPFHFELSNGNSNDNNRIIAIRESRNLDMPLLIARVHTNINNITLSLSVPYITRIITPKCHVNFSIWNSIFNTSKNYFKILEENDLKIAMGDFEIFNFYENQKSHNELDLIEFLNYVISTGLYDTKSAHNAQEMFEKELIGLKKKMGLPLSFKEYALDL
jgi:hypothetical protein